jgi:hypothetical protein
MSSAPSSPHFSILEAPSSPVQSVATPRLYGFCYKVETTCKSDTVTSYSIKLNPHAEACPAPCNKDCANNRLGEPTPGEPWRNYNYLSCLAGQGLFHLAQDAYKTNADIHVQIMRCTDDPNLLHANVIKAWGERHTNPQDSDASSYRADADSKLSSMPLLEAMSLLELPPPQRPDSPYPFPSVVQAQQVLTYKEQADRLIRIACCANNNPSGCDAEQGTYPLLLHVPSSSVLRLQGAHACHIPHASLPSLVQHTVQVDLQFANLSPFDPILTTQVHSQKTIV